MFFLKELYNSHVVTDRAASTFWVQLPAQLYPKHLMCVVPSIILITEE